MFSLHGVRQLPRIGLCLALVISLLVVPIPFSGAQAVDDAPLAAWMEQGWGIRFLLPWGNSHDAENIDVNKLIDQVAAIPDLYWVQLNVTRGAGGDQYTAPIPWLGDIMGDHISPERDLLGQAIERAKYHGLKVFVYVGSTGPLMDRNPHLMASEEATERWKDWVAEQTGRAFTVEDSRQLFGDEVVGWFSEAYPDIDGWWFDHADYGDYQALARGARAGNSQAVLAFNRGVKLPLQNNTLGWENFTHGHPNPVKNDSPSSEVTSSCRRRPSGEAASSSSSKIRRWSGCRELCAPEAHGPGPLR